MNIDRILSVFKTNFRCEKRGVVWNACMDAALKVELNETNLENMCQTPLVSGFGGGGGRPEAIRLAEALGACGISNPENDAFNNRHVPPPSNCDNQTMDEILDRIQPFLPFKIQFPPFSGNCLQGIVTKFGVTSNRHIFYLWVLKRIMELCPDRDSAIIEIGAGFGLLGYYLDKVGYRDYTTIDLALVNACQTYFLKRNLPDRRFILSGDVDNQIDQPFNSNYKDAIKLLHTTDFHNVLKGRFDIMINMDGLTEYGYEEARKYVQSDCADTLLSINHEVNTFRVFDIDQPHRKLKQRNLFWLRPGYVEEIYIGVPL